MWDEECYVSYLLATDQSRLILFDGEAGHVMIKENIKGE